MGVRFLDGQKIVRMIRLVVLLVIVKSSKKCIVGWFVLKIRWFIRQEKVMFVVVGIVQLLVIVLQVLDLRKVVKLRYMVIGLNMLFVVVNKGVVVFLLCRELFFRIIVFQIFFVVIVKKNVIRMLFIRQWNDRIFVVFGDLKVLQFLL